MLSHDHLKTIDAASQLIRFLKNADQQESLRYLSDIILKWVFLRLWGGNPALQSLIEVLPPLLAILQKKSLFLNEGEL